MSEIDEKMSNIQFISIMAKTSKRDYWNTATIARLIKGKPYKKFPQEYAGIDKDKLQEMLELLKYGNKAVNKIVEDDDIEALLSARPMICALNVIQYGGNKAGGSEKQQLIREENSRHDRLKREITSIFNEKIYTLKSEQERKAVVYRVDSIPKNTITREEHQILSKMLHSDITGGSDEGQAIINSLYDKKIGKREELKEKHQQDLDILASEHHAALNDIDGRDTQDVVTETYQSAVDQVRRYHHD